MSRTNIVKCVDEPTKDKIRETFEKKDFKTKTKLAEKYGISLRTLNRILKEGEGGKEETVYWNYVITKNEVNLFRNEDSRIIKRGTPMFGNIKNFLVGSDLSDNVLEQAWDMCCLKKQIETFSLGNITVDYENNEIKYGNFVIKNSVTKRIIQKLEEGQDSQSDGIQSIVKFLDKVMDNPDKEIIEQLYPFLEHNDIEINEDGDIIAWRGVSYDYKDRYTGTMDNSVGTTVKMPRHLVDTNPKVTCSQGLHCAAYEYARSWGDRIMKVLVHPKDVCSVPVDYEGQKMRCCEFKVLSEEK